MCSLCSSPSLHHPGSLETLPSDHYVLVNLDAHSTNYIPVLANSRAAPPQSLDSCQL